MRKLEILSVDLDFFWKGTETNFQNPAKDRIEEFRSILNKLSVIRFNIRHVGIDHNSLMQILDNYFNSFAITNVDAHHDLYAKNINAWLRPLFIRGKEIGIGDFIFQSIREERLSELNWITQANKSVAYWEKDIIQNIGNYYAQRVHIFHDKDFIFKNQYDLLFVAVSPEWIPKYELSEISNMLNLLGFGGSTIDEILSKTQKRWSFLDNSRELLSDRFSMPNKYYNLI